MQNKIFNLAIFEVKNNKINLTKICQSFSKDIREWTKLKSTKAFISALEKDEGDSTHLEVIHGVGTFGTREVAIKLAQWISAEFEVFCITKLDELFQTGKTQIETRKPKTLSTLDLLKLNVQAIEKLQEQNKKLESDVTKLATRDLEVKTEKEYKWKEEVKKDDLGRSINYYVNKLFFTGSYPESHQIAKETYRQATGVSLPDHAKAMTLEQKTNYLKFLSKYA